MVQYANQSRFEETRRIRWSRLIFSQLATQLCMGNSFYHKHEEEIEEDTTDSTQTLQIKTQTSVKEKTSRFRSNQPLLHFILVTGIHAKNQPLFAEKKHFFGQNAKGQFWPIFVAKLRKPRKIGNNYRT